MNRPESKGFQGLKRPAFLKQQRIKMTNQAGWLHGLAAI